MLTPSELRNAQFSKARLGGYVMSEVDKLLDEVTPDYEALYNENAELRKKVEVLLDRLDRYQEQEDSIKAAILNAQRMCDTIVAQARQQAALIEQDAKIKAGRVAEEAQRSIQDKHDELVSIRREVTQFRSRLVNLYRSHLEKIKEIPSFEEEGPSQQAEAGRPSDGLAQTGASSAPSLREDGQASAQLPDLEQTMEFTPPRADAVSAEALAAPEEGRPESGASPAGQPSGAEAPASEGGPAAAAQAQPEASSAGPQEQPEPHREQEVQEPEEAPEEKPAMVVEMLDDDAPLPYLAGEPPLDDDEIDYSGIHSLNLGDSLEFGTEFDIATGKRR